MSYHIYIENNKELKLVDILESNYLPENVHIAFGKDKNEIIKEYSKLYLPLKSLRGVVITKNNDEYDVELNTGASTEDYYLAAKIALALSVLNASKITPEFDDSLSFDEFEKKYDMKWAEESQALGINALRYLVNENASTVQLNGCKRAYYFGKTKLQELSIGNPSEKVFAERVIESIRHIQFIEETDTSVNVPTLMEADFPEGVQTLNAVVPGFRLLLIKSDLIILRDEKNVLKVSSNDFLDHISVKNKLTKVDEAQYILEPIYASEYSKLMDFFAKKEQIQQGGKTKSWWKFWK